MKAGQRRLKRKAIARIYSYLQMMSVNLLVESFMGFTLPKTAKLCKTGEVIDTDE